MINGNGESVTQGTPTEDGSASGSPEGLLTIAEMSRQSGVAASDLRNWESRYGFPSPQRSQNGRRLYTLSDKDTVLRVLAHREAGLSLAGAINLALSTTPATTTQSGEASLFASLRRSHPELPVHVLDKRTLLALTRAIEDCCFATAQKPILVGAFQEQRHFRPAEARWTDMASSSLRTIAFAATGTQGPQGPQGSIGSLITSIALPDGSPLRREWALICDAVEQPACVVGRERPGQERSADPTRIFETIWSVDPTVVRQASRVALSIAARHNHDVPDIDSILADRAAVPARVDARHISELLGRTLEYLTKAA